VTVRYDEPFKFEVVEHSTREQQQQAADYILARIKTVHGDLERLGHKGALQASRQRTAPVAS
jgi:hypothetical protein